MLKSPESEIQAKFFADMGEKCGEKMANFFADFRPSISKKSGRKKFHEKLATNSAGREIKFFHRETLGVWGHNKSAQKTLEKHSWEHSEAGAQNHTKSTPCGTFRPGPLSTPVNGGRDRNHGPSSKFLDLLPPASHPCKQRDAQP